MQGNAEQFLLAQPNITNMTFEKIITLCQQRFYVTKNQAAARTKNTYHQLALSMTYVKLP